MIDRKQNDLSRRELEEPRNVPARRSGIGRIVMLISILLVVLGAVLLAAYWDLSNFDSLRRLFIYNKVEQDEVGRAHIYSYDNDRSNVFSMLGSRLIVVSTTRMAILDRDGTEIFSQAVKLENPALTRGGKMVAVYDVGGTALYLLGERGLVRDMSEVSENGILSVKLNSSDYMAVVTNKNGYKSGVSVYNTSGDAVFTFNSATSYILDACCERDCKGVALMIMGEQDGMFESSVLRYSFDSEIPRSTCSIPDTLVFTLDTIGQSLVALADDRFAGFASDGSLAGAYLYSYPYLRDYTLSGKNFGAIVLSRYRSGSAGKLVSLNADGTMLASLEIHRNVLDLDANGQYLAVLYDNALVIYTSDLTEYAVLEDTHYAKAVLMKDDGSAVILGAAEGWLFLP